MGRKLKTYLLIVLSLSLLAWVVSTFVARQRLLEERADFYQSLADQEKEWILRCQMPDGLLLYREWSTDPGAKKQTVIPYFSSIAAWGMLAGTVTPEQAQGVACYLNWYLDHLNTAKEDPVNGDGTIYDYLVVQENGKTHVESAGTYDSVDSYAAMFLITAECYAQKVGTQLLKERRADIKRVADALLRTLEENGLSIVKQEYPVQYLMDNAEVYAGLQAGAKLIQEIAPGDWRIQTMDQAAADMAQAFETLLWNEDAGLYEIGLVENGEPIDQPSWSEFYPDSTAQLFPVCFGVLDPESDRAQQIYQRFCKEWNWADLEHQVSDISTFYWCVICYSAALQGDEVRLQQFIRNYKSALDVEGRGYPLYLGDAGWAALACGWMEQSYRSRIW